MGQLQQIQLRQSDIISFHNYSWPEYFKRQVAWLKKYKRPVICTEYMARPVGSTFDALLPIAKQEQVGMSWQHPYLLEQPPVWFHDVLRPDGTPYRLAEVRLIRELTGKQ